MVKGANRHGQYVLVRRGRELDPTLISPNPDQRIETPRRSKPENARQKETCRMKHEPFQE